MSLPRKKIKFGIGLGVVLMTIAWLAYSGIQESKTYYVTVGELQGIPNDPHRRLRVAGDVATGSIRKSAGRVEFALEQEGKMLNVVYTGSEPLPDTLQDGAQAMADGRYREDGYFHAEMVQAKCASKYEPAAMESGSAADAAEVVPAIR